MAEVEALMGICTRCGKKAGFMMSLCSPCIAAAEEEVARQAAESAPRPRSTPSVPAQGEESVRDLLARLVDLQQSQLHWSRATAIAAVAALLMAMVFGFRVSVH